jgi:mycothiol synthase
MSSGDPAAGPGPQAVQVSGALSPAQASEVLGLAEHAARADGVAPLSEQGMLHVRYGGGRGAAELLASSDGQLAGYARLDPPAGGEPAAGELVVGPAFRRRGLGRALAEAMAAQAGPDGLRVWAHGDLPAARALAAAAGFARARSLWQMRRPLAEPLAEPRLAAGITVRAFRPGQDEDAWLALNATAFATHPEQGAWTSADLEQREREAWFDPAGFFLAVRGDRLAGYHWTKIHPAEGAEPAIGEVYVVGVDPAERGTGLGRALTLIGLSYLRDRELGEVLLYVDESNVAAIRLYESLGFARWSADVMFSRAGRLAGPGAEAGGLAGQLVQTDPAGQDRTPRASSSSASVSGRSLAATALSTSAYSAISSRATMSWTRRSRYSPIAPTSVALPGSTGLCF